MKLYSTNNHDNIADLSQAVLKSLADDKGLYMPIHLPKLDANFIKYLHTYTFEEIAYTVSSALFQGYIPEGDLRQICDTAINFEAPVVRLSEQVSTLELFHGPSLAFKDFGARYMAQLMSYFNKDKGEKLTILVATSGDTGGAVAAGFLDTPGIEVIILYPSGRVSDLQEKQLTALGKNIYACEIQGSFDDCQAMVKTAFLDPDLQQKYNLSSANSINIARLIPQAFYYFEAFKQLDASQRNVFAVPSGNFGNMTAGLLAQRMGLPIDHFIAATNLNQVVPDYLNTGNYEPKPSLATISNAMDVGAPSNFVRMQALFGSDHTAMQQSIKGYFYDDAATLAALREIYDTYGYVADPHGAVGYLAAKQYIDEVDKSAQVTFLETAHPAKFSDTVERAIGKKVDIPHRLAILQDEPKVATILSNAYTDFKGYLLER